MFSYHLTLRNYHMFENEKLPPLAYYIYIYTYAATRLGKGGRGWKQTQIQINV